MRKKSLISIAGLSIAFGAIETRTIWATTVPPDTSVPANNAASTAPGVSTATAPGLALDSTFGSDGVLSVNANGAGHDRFISVATGSDGAVYASGFVDLDGDHAFLVSKFTADGVLDETYGDAGSAVVNIVEGGGDAEVARGLVVGDDGSVTVSGPVDHDPAAAEPDNEDNDAAVVRLDPSGALDATFGTGGVAIFDLGAGKAVDAETYLADDAWGLAARDGGYVLFASSPNQEPDRIDSDFNIVGITDAGVLDDTFGLGGAVVVDINASIDNARNVKVDDHGRVLAAGYSRDGDGIVSPVLIRLNPDGTPDDTFGDGGVANHIVLDAVTEAYGVAFQGDDYILSGYGRAADDVETVDQVTYRFTADGSWDETFGEGGVTRINFANQDDRGRNVATLPDGSIVVVGSGKLDETNLDALVVLLDPNGAPVPGFGDNGLLLIDLGGAGDAFFGVSVTDDASAVYLAGFKGGAPDTDEQDDALLVRLTTG